MTRRTRTGILLLAVGWACFPLALAVGSLAPALVGALLVALAVTRPAPRVTVTVARDAPVRAVAGDTVTVTTRAEDAGGDAPLFIDETAPAGLTPVSTRHAPGRGRAERVTTYRVAHPGAHAWAPVTVRYQDAWGLVEDAVTVPASGFLHVAPEPRHAKEGEQAARQGRVGSPTRRHDGERQPEIERLRGYVPGDRFRDIDWAHSTKLGDLVARELKRESRRPVLVLLQATPSMRQDRRVPKLATAARAALAAVAAGHAAGAGVGLVAWSERGVEALVRVQSTQRAVTEATMRVANLPPTSPTANVPAPRVVTDVAASRALTPGERAFLAASRAFAATAGARSATPLETALAAVTQATQGPSFVVALLDAEEDPAMVSVLVQRLTRKGHEVVVASPASGAHHYALTEVDDAVLARLLAWRRNREVAADACRRHRARFVPLGPHLTRADVKEVVTSAP